MRRAPAQRFEHELLDRPIDDGEALRNNLLDMALANRLLLSNRSALRQIERWLAIGPATILDVATGIGSLPWAIERWARRRGYRVRLIASDLDAAIIAIARQMLGRRKISLVRHDALRMPFGDQSIDIVTCAFALHHFPRAAAVALLREMARVARRGVVVSDLRRSYGGYFAARLLALGPINWLSRHDGPLSVLRAYTPAEARAIMAEAGMRGDIRAEPVFRLRLTLDKTHRLA